MSTENITIETTGSATYSPEDNKLRLYIGRVPREEFLKLRAEGWVTLHKQRDAGGGDFAAVWTPERRDTALEYGGGVILDEDMGPAERAADRAERFSGYRDKRLSESIGHADRYDSGPAVHGYQSQARAERAAARHDRIADRAGDAWNKAEYWTRRTAGVINHALYKQSPAVRMGRIKTIETELRRDEKTRAEAAARFEGWRNVANETDTEKQNRLAFAMANVGGGYDYINPKTGGKGSLYCFLRDDQDPENRITGAEAAALYMAVHVDPLTPAWEETRLAEWINHHKLRIAYENQMCEAAGGRASLVEMVPGGFIGSHQIRKVVKSPVTKAVVSVEVMGSHTGYTKESGYTERATKPCPVLLNIERLKAEVYRPPTDEELQAFNAAMKAEKDGKPKVVKPALINPTDADAERLQKLWNEKALADHCESHIRRYGKDYASEFKPSTVCRITQAVYSANSKGNYSRAETKGIHGGGIPTPAERFYRYEEQAEEKKRLGAVVCQLRITSGDGSDYGAKRVIILTDKPQKALPAEVWEKHVVAETAELVTG